MTDHDRGRRGSPTPSTPSAGSPTVAVVTSDARAGLVLRHALESRGWAVTWTHAPRALLRRGDAGRYRALLALIDGAEMEALEMLAALAAQPESPPVVLLTRLATAASLGPAVLGGLGVERLLSWPSRIDPIAAALDEVSSRPRPRAGVVSVATHAEVAP